MMLTMNGDPDKPGRESPKQGMRRFVCAVRREPEKIPAISPDKILTQMNIRGGCSC